MEDVLNILLELDKLYLPYNVNLSIFKDIENKGLIDHINRIGIEIYNREND